MDKQKDIDEFVEHAKEVLRKPYETTPMTKADWVFLRERLRSDMAAIARQVQDITRLINNWHRYKS